MTILRSGSKHPVIDYFSHSVQSKSNYVQISGLLQGHLTDFCFVAKDGRSINCHKIVVAALSPFMKSLVGSSSESDQIILPDFGMAEIRGLMNFYYTGRFVDITLEGV